MEEKTISRQVIAASVKKEYAEAREWCDQSPFHCYNMMIDTSDGEIWSDVFPNGDNWKEYHSSSIRALDYVPGYDLETEKGYVVSAVQALEAAGWTVTD